MTSSGLPTSVGTHDGAGEGWSSLAVRAFKIRSVQLPNEFITAMSFFGSKAGGGLLGICVRVG